MEKKTVKAVTRKQKFLAAIAGDTTAPNPITSNEKLMYNIAEKSKEDSGGSGGGSGGGVMVVQSDINGTLDKTWQEIHDADFAVLKQPLDGDSVRCAILSLAQELEGQYGTVFVYFGQANTAYIFVTDSPDGYPVIQGSGDGGGGDDSTPV